MNTRLGLKRKQQKTGEGGLIILITRRKLRKGVFEVESTEEGETGFAAKGRNERRLR